MIGPDPVDATARAFARGRFDPGYVEGKNLALTQLSAEGRTELVAEAVRRQADVIVTISTPMAQRAKEVTTTFETRRSEDGTRAWAAEVGEYYMSFTGEYGGLWRRQGRAPNLLTGVGFISQGFSRDRYSGWLPVTTTR